MYSHSLLLVMGTVFLLSWPAQSITGTAAYNEQRLRQLQARLSWADYLGAADFWNRTLQKLAVRAPCRRLDGGALDLLAATRVPGVEAGGRGSRRHRSGRLKMRKKV
ncbi:DUF6766 family protein [Streptomyces umbrinus]|uniref:DUF6766 family protein n=1 Tax=Streptomyces umbrinus TaxID=67370 RepID=UPI003C2C3207